MLIERRNFQKNKGFTLIEVVICLGILLVIVSISISNIFKLNKVITTNTGVNFYDNYILSIISNSSKYCQLENKSGYLLFDDKNNSIKFFCNNSNIEQYEGLKGFKFVDAELFNKTIEINNFGILTKSCTIKYMDSLGKINSITIRVGTKYVQIKEK